MNSLREINKYLLITATFFAVFLISPIKSMAYDPGTPGSNFEVCIAPVVWTGISGGCYVFQPTPTVSWSSSQNVLAAHCSAWPYIGSCGGSLTFFQVSMPGFSSNSSSGSHLIPASQNLGFNTNFNVSITANDNFGASIWHSENFTTPSQCPPAAPSGLSIAYSSCHNVTASFVDNSNNEDGFRVYKRRLNPLGGWTVLCLGPAGSSGCTGINNPDGAKWEYEVASYNAGNTVYNTDANVISTQELCTPSLSSVTVNSCTSVSVVWTNTSSNEDGYRVTGVDRDGVRPSVTYNSVPNDTSQTINGLSDGVNWRFSVLTFKAGEPNSPSSNTIDVQTPLCSFTLTSAISGGCRSASVDWTDTSVNEGGYTVFYDDNNSIPVNDMVSVLLPANTVNDSPVNLIDGVDWDVYVVKSSALGKVVAVPSVTSNHIVPMTTELCQPSLSSVTVNSCTSVSVVWTNTSSNEDGYRVTGVDRDGVRPTVTYNSVPNDTSQTINGFSDGVNWTFSVLTFKSGQPDSSSSNTINAQTPLCPFTLDSAVDNGCRGAIVDWSDTSVNEGGYTVFYDDFNNAVPVNDMVSALLSAITTNDSPVNLIDGVDWDVYVVKSSAVPSLPSVPSVTSNTLPMTTELCQPIITSLTDDGTCHNMTVNWEDNSVNEDGYMVSFDDPTGDEDTNSILFGVINPGTGSMTMTRDIPQLAPYNGLPDGVAWEVYVWVYNDEGGSFNHMTVSPMVQHDTILCAPTAFTNITISDDCTQILPPPTPATDLWTITLDWTDNSWNETGYSIRWDMGGGWNYLPFTSADVETNSALYFPSEVYNYEVRAENDLFVSEWAPTSTPPMENYATTTSCNADLDIINDDEEDCDCIDIQWTTEGDVNDVDHYRIFRDTSGSIYGDDTYALVLDNISNATTSFPNIYDYQDCEIVSGSVTYTYYVETCFDVGCTEPDRLVSYPDGDGESTNPCQKLPRWEESN